MTKNVGKKDAIMRYVLAVIFLFLGYTVSWLFYILAFAMVATAYLGTCFLYKLVGVNTCKFDK